MKVQSKTRMISDLRVMRESQEEESDLMHLLDRLAKRAECGINQERDLCREREKKTGPVVLLLQRPGNLALPCQSSARYRGIPVRKGEGVDSRRTKHPEEPIQNLMQPPCQAVRRD